MTGGTLDGKQQGLVLRLFGPAEVLVDGLPLPPLRSRKALWLLALLTLRVNRSVQREWLASMLWPDTDHEKALANLRTVLSELRKALGVEGRRLQPIDRHTISFDIEGANVDLVEFDQAIASGTHECLQLATSLYQGALLEGCGEEWVLQERIARERECLQALQKLGDASLAGGDAKAAIAWYGRAVAIDPLWEAAHRGMMEALFRDGDVNGAFYVYRSYSDLLRREMGAVPDQRTTQLYERLRLTAREQGQPQKKEPSQLTKGFVPHPLTELVGREDERTELTALLRRSRLVTLTGVGGIGKTRLAIALASDLGGDFPDGIWFVALDSLAEGALIPLKIGALMGLTEQQKQTWLETVVNHLRTQRVLVVLDNCEHLLDSCAQVVAHMLRECPGLRILATSREALGMAGESTWPVPSLAVPEPMHLPSGSTTMQRVLVGYEGVQLFIERAQAAHRGFALTAGNTKSIAEICHRLEGIPLAIELAAARAKSMTIDQILGRLGDHLGLLTSRTHSAAPRQHALSSTLNWSYELLTEPEQILLRRLAVFVGGWTLEAAERTCCDANAKTATIQGEGVLDLLTSLVDKSLVVFQETSLGARYRYLEMVRQYAAKKLEESSELSEVKGRFLAWCVYATEEVERHIGGAEQLLWMQRLEADFDNFRTALEEGSNDQAVVEACLRIAGAMWRFWHRRGRHGEGRRYLGLVLERDTRKAPTSFRAKALYGSGALFGEADDPNIRTRLTEESLRIYRELDDRHQICACVRSLGNAAFHRNDFQAAWDFGSEALALSRELGDAGATAHNICTLGLFAAAKWEFANAEALFREGIGLMREGCDQNVFAWALSCLADLVRDNGDFVAAKALYEEALSVSQAIGFNAVTISVLNSLGIIADEHGDYETAKALVNESLRISHQIGDLHGRSIWLRTMGIISFHEGDLVSARSSFVESLRLAREFGGRRETADALSSLGRLDLHQQSGPSARSAISESFHIYREISNLRGSVDSLEDLAALGLAEQRVREATIAWASASALRERYALITSARDLKDRKERTHRARLLLGEAEFEEAWNIGCQQSLDQAAADLLAAPDSS